MRVDPRPVRLPGGKVFALATLDITYGACRRFGYHAVRLVKPSGDVCAIEARVEWPHAPGGVDPPCVVGVNVGDGLRAAAGDIVEFSASDGGAA